MVKIEDLKINWYPAPDKEYHKDIFAKKQIVLHHTASGGNSKGDMDYLNGDQQGAVNVSFFIDRDGTLWQAFSSKFYAAHLGTPTSTFTKFKVKNNVSNLHKSSIGIELDSWGYLTFKNGKYLTWKNTEIKPENVITHSEPYLGYKHYEKYYPAQLAKLKLLLQYLSQAYNISLVYNCNMWEVSSDALSGKNGVWSHTSFRETGKWDVHPDPELIKMLKLLK